MEPKAGEHEGRVGASAGEFCQSLLPEPGAECVWEGTPSAWEAVEAMGRWHGR